MSSQIKDYYGILGVDKSATQSQIKAAYRKLAIKFHPDKNVNNPSAESQFKDISEAYDVLSNEEKRSKYDNDDILSSINNRHWTSGGHFKQKKDRRNYRGSRGQDLHMKIELSLQEVFNGTKKTIHYNKYIKCESCSGLGADDLITKECGKCLGSGRIEELEFSSNGRSGMMRSTPCQICDGVGSVFVNKCKTCSGDGRISHRTTINITIPKGVKGRSTSEMSGGGHQGKHLGQCGNLVVTYIEVPHEKFTRIDDDIHSDINIPISMAVFGGKVSVETMMGNQVITIPKGTKDGDKVTLRDFGVPRRDIDESGSHIIHVHINIPQRLTSEQSDIIQKLKDTGL